MNASSVLDANPRPNPARLPRFKGFTLTNPLLFVVLLSCCIYVSVQLISALLPQRVDDIGKLTLSTLPHATVICYQPGCGCEANTNAWIDKAATTRKNVVIVGYKWEPLLTDVRERYADRGVRVYVILKKSLVDKLSPTGKSTLSVISYGKIKNQFTGAQALAALDKTENAK